MTRRAWILCSLACAVLAARAVAACGSETAGEVVPPTEADASRRDPSANCVKPGTKNNDQGIGGYCEVQTDCVPGQSLCTGVFGAPDNAWFCSRLCAEDPDCGVGLYCAVDPRGTVCVPLVCGVADAGDGGD